MSNKNLEKLRMASQLIVGFLNSEMENGNIMAFRTENQFQLNKIAIYILANKADLAEIQHSFFINVYDVIISSDLSLNVLYNYIEDDTMYDMEFIQGNEEFKRGYSVREFGYLCEPSDMDIEFYA